MRLYHACNEVIQNPDVHYGRKNADFGQGFYLSDDLEFSKRWAKERRGMDTVINVYELNPEGLSILALDRNAEWFDYIFDNRNWKKDAHGEDVIIGPIANDTLYDVLGITTSGILNKEQSFQLLNIGPIYKQIVLKTAKASSQLQWIDAIILESKETEYYRNLVKQEEAEFQRLFAEEMDRI